MPGGCRPGDLAKIVGSDRRQEEQDLGKLVKVGTPCWIWGDHRRYFRCESISGPLFAIRVYKETGKFTGDCVKAIFVDIPDMHLEPIRDLPQLFDSIAEGELVML